MSSEHSPARARKIMRIAAVMEATGLSRTTIWRHVREGRMPAPMDLGPNSIGWFDDVIRAHQDSQIAVDQSLHSRWSRSHG